MALIQPVAIEEALRSGASKQPSARFLRRQAIKRDAEAVVQAIQSQGAATIDFATEDQPGRYFAGLRAALQRKGYSDILMQKKRGQDQAVAWKMRQEGEARVETRRRTGLRLGQAVKERAGTGRSRRRAS